MLLLLACAAPPEGWTTTEQQLIRSLSPIPPPPVSRTNAVADLPEAAALGRQIFFDTGFSANGAVSCATCHQPERHFTDGQPVATTAFGTGTRNVPTVEGAAWNTWFFWDGRADSAWAQATGPLRNPIEHALTAEAVQARVRSHYAEPFTTVFGAISDDPDRVLAQVGKAIEAYERTLAPQPARFDAYVAELAGGAAGTSLTEQEELGLRLFIGEAGCINCHNGPLFTDHHFHNLGLPRTPRGLDPGRAGGLTVMSDTFNCAGPHSDNTDCPELRFLDPSFPDWAAAFKTPSLRNVTATGPYMHDGSLDTLQAVLLFYNTLPGQPMAGHRELTLKPLGLNTEELSAIEAFLGTLTSEPAPH